jgi:phytoene desaturase
MAKKVIIVGGGTGGLTAAMLLAHKGLDVTVFEKQNELGGRSGALRMGGYTFDLGCTMLMLKFVLDEMFELVGERIDDHLVCERLNPLYQLCFGDLSLNMFSEPEAMRSELEKHFPGSAQGYDLFMRREKKRLQMLFPGLQRDYSTLRGLLSRDLIAAVPYLAIGQSMYGVIGKYFSEETLKIAMTFQSQYLGMSPWNCPGGFAIIPFLEHYYGIYHVHGGINRIPAAMSAIVEKKGGRIHTGTGVRHLIITNKKATGVVLEDGSAHHADAVIVNADAAYSLAHLMNNEHRTRYTPKKLKNMRYSCSTFMIYLGLDTVWKTPAHHTFLFARDVRKNMDDIFSHYRLPEDFSIYIANPAVNDPSMAPSGGSALYILVPVPNTRADIDWKQHKQAFRDKVLGLLEQRAEFKGLRAHIRCETVITPQNWERDFNIFYGAPFSLAHSLDQMLCFRPRNKFDEIESCFLVGGGTSPGSGLPTIYESARISTNSMLRQFNMTPYPVRPLPR